MMRMWCERVGLLMVMWLVSGTCGHRMPTAAGARHEQYYCAQCSVGFAKRKNYEAHLAGKRHAGARSRGEAAARCMARSAWASVADAAEARREFELDGFLRDLPRRSSGGVLSPRLRTEDLTPAQRGRLFRYLYDRVPEEAARAICRVESRFGRVKEILESVEVFRAVERRVAACNGLTSVLDVASGHGLVARLVATRFPDLDVESSDLVRRDSVDAWQRAFAGCAHVPFRAADVRDLDLDPTSLVVCVHGCDDVNRLVLDAATKRQAPWLVVPCCLKAANYLQPGVALKKGKRSAWAPLPDDARYAFLCGALAAKFHATSVDHIDSRITARSIVLSGGPLLPSSSSCQ